MRAIVKWSSSASAWVSSHWALNNLLREAPWDGSLFQLSPTSDSLKERVKYCPDFRWGDVSLNICKHWARHGVNIVPSKASSLAFVLGIWTYIWTYLTLVPLLCQRIHMCGTMLALICLNWVLYTLFLLCSDCAQNLESYANSVNK